MHRRDSRFLSRKNIVLTVIVAVGAIVLLCTPVRLAVSGALFTVAPVAWSASNSTDQVKIGFFANLRIKRSLVYENTILREEVARMQALVLDRNLLEERVVKLEEALGRAGNDNRVSADVISIPGQSLYDVLVIDAGLDNGISVGDSVVYAGAGAIGEIAEAYQSSSKVKLYSSPGLEHAVLVGGDYIPGLAHGRGMGNFEVKVPKGSKVFAGDTVVLQKGNLVLGVVGALDEEPTLPFVDVLFRTTFNIADIRSVEVLTSNAIYTK